MQIIAETHSHTVACDHAFSTLYENVRYAARSGIRFLCVTEHCPAMEGAPGGMFFSNLPNVIPDLMEGVVVLKGAETNIIDYEGGLDLPDRKLARLDWVIASYHINCLAPATEEEHTAGWLAVAKNPLVDVIGHAGDERYRFDVDAVVKAFAENGKIVEINAHSFECRPGSAENCRRIAESCKKYGGRVVCSSDAHFFTQIGNVGAAVEMLEEIGFPEELVMNADYGRFLALAREKSGRPLI